jgi:hypothetical protein
MTLVARVVDVLEGNGVAAAVIGGVALAAAGVARSTLDVDLLTTETRVLDAGMWASLQASGVTVEIRRGDQEDPLGGLVRFEATGERPVDVILGKYAWQTRAVERAVHVGGGPAVVSPRDLVLLKLYAGGTQDTWDIVELLQTPQAKALAAEVEDDLRNLPASMRQRWATLRQPTPRVPPT